MTCCRQTLDPRPFGPEGCWCWLPITSPPAHQKNVHQLITPSLNPYYKMPPGQYTKCWGHKPTVYPFVWSSNKLFFFILHSELCLWDLILYWCAEARLSFKFSFLCFSFLLLPKLLILTFWRNGSKISKAGKCVPGSKAYGEMPTSAFIFLWPS